MFIFSPSEAEKQPRVPKIVSLTRKMTNVMKYITFLILPHIGLIWEVCRSQRVPGAPDVDSFIIIDIAICTGIAFFS